MRPGVRLLLASLLLLAGQISSAEAGMPSPLPIHPAQVLRLKESAEMRLQVISFFLVGLLLCAGTVQVLWNYLRRDFAKLPRLSFGKALAGVLLWGLLFVVVLTMISGARELMTPGAWRKDGFTYKLSSEAGAGTGADSVKVRRQQMEHLRAALWQFAATHNGRFPVGKEVDEIAGEVWTVPESGGMRFQYVPGVSASAAAAILAYDPELDPEQRLVLQTNGVIAVVTSADLRSLRKTESSP